MTKLNLSQREKDIVIIFVIVAGLALVFRAVYIPLKNKSDEVREKIAVSEKKLNKNLKMIRKGENYEARYKPLLENFQQKGSDEQMMSAILNEIESAAGQVQVRIADMKPQRVKKSGSYNNFSVSLTLDGELTAIMDFIYGLQNQPHLFAVDELRLEKKSPNTKELKGYFVLSRISIQP